LADENAKPIDVDREFVTLFFIWDENGSELNQKSLDKYCPGFTNPNPDDFIESNKRHSINGMFMGNLPGLDTNKGERVRWYVMGLGNSSASQLTGTGLRFFFCSFRYQRIVCK